jgi:hypothetical protein
MVRIIIIRNVLFMSKNICFYVVSEVHFCSDNLSPYGSMESLASNTSTITLKSLCDEQLEIPHSLNDVPLSTKHPIISNIFEASGLAMIWTDHKNHLLYISPHLGRRLRSSWVIVIFCHNIL